MKVSHSPLTFNQKRVNSSIRV